MPVTDALGIAEDVEDGFFHFQMGHHFAGDFAEAREAVGDAQEAFVIEQGDVAGDIPAVVKNLRGAVGLVEVAEHAVGAFHQQQTFGIWGQGGEGDGIDNARGDSGMGWPTVPALLPVCGVLAGGEIGDVDGHHGRHLGAAVAFQELDAEFFAEGVGDGLAEFLGAHQDVAQAGEFLGGALAV